VIVIQEMSRAHYIRYLRFYYYHCVDISARELLVLTRYIIRPNGWRVWGRSYRL